MTPGTGRLVLSCNTGHFGRPRSSGKAGARGPWVRGSWHPHSGFPVGVLVCKGQSCRSSKLSISVSSPREARGLVSRKAGPQSEGLLQGGPPASIPLWPEGTSFPFCV